MQPDNSDRKFFFCYQKTRKLPSPYDAIVRGEESIFCAMLVMSLAVISSKAFKKCSTGFLRGRITVVLLKYFSNPFHEARLTRNIKEMDSYLSKISILIFPFLKKKEKRKWSSQNALKLLPPKILNSSIKISYNVPPDKIAVR